MNNDVEDLLREGMERFNADLRAPAGLIQRAARRRRRRLALRSAAGTVALAAGAAALVAVVVPGGRYDGTGSAADAAYVVNRVDSALSAAEPGAIAQMTVTTRTSAIPGGTVTTTTAEEWSYGDQWRSVTDSRAGHPVYDEGYSSSAFTLVSYLTRTWARQPGLGRPAVLAGPGALGAAAAPKNRPVPLPSSCQPGIAALPLLLQPGLPGIGFSASAPPATVAKALHTEISCGTLTVAGRQHVDGIGAIELTSRGSSPVSETIWVNPGTYLPVRIVVRTGPGPQALQRTADITWLQPTAQNLAKLTVPIPAGFRRVPLATAVTAILQQVPGGPSKAQGICPALTGPDGGTRPALPAPFRARPAIPGLASSPPANIRILLGPGDIC
jgi:hypothetical protein